MPFDMFIHSFTPHSHFHTLVCIVQSYLIRNSRYTALYSFFNNCEVQNNFCKKKLNFIGFTKYHILKPFLKNFFSYKRYSVIYNVGKSRIIIIFIWNVANFLITFLLSMCCIRFFRSLFTFSLKSLYSV